MKLLKEILRNEAGQALPIALVLLLFGGFFVVPCLSLLSTSLNANRLVDQRTLELYAADAGIEDGLWRIQTDELPEWMKGTWDEDTYKHGDDLYCPPCCPYCTNPGDDPPYPELIVNSCDLETCIKPIWVLEGLETSQKRTPPVGLVVAGDFISQPGDNGKYRISILYDGSVDDLKVERVGCWLPAGFDYVEDSSNLEEEPTTSDYNGGTTVIWDFLPAIDYDDLPALGTKKVVEFEFTPKEDPQGDFSWMRTDEDDVKLAWDVVTVNCWSV